MKKSEGKGKRKEIYEKEENMTKSKEETKRKKVIYGAKGRKYE